MIRVARMGRERPRPLPRRFHGQGDRVSISVEMKMIIAGQVLRRTRWGLRRPRARPRPTLTLTLTALEYLGAEPHQRHAQEAALHADHDVRPAERGTLVPTLTTFCPAVGVRTDGGYALEALGCVVQTRRQRNAYRTGRLSLVIDHE